MAKPSMVSGVRGASETNSTARRPASQASCWGKKAARSVVSPSGSWKVTGEAGRVRGRGDVVQSRPAQCRGSAWARRRRSQAEDAAATSWSIQAAGTRSTQRCFNATDVTKVFPARRSGGLQVDDDPLPGAAPSKAEGGTRGLSSSLPQRGRRHASPTHGLAATLGSSPSCFFP
jgi:hypothetical protein